MKNIAVFGANGNIGHQAVNAFKNNGWQVRAITRDGSYKHGAKRSAKHIESVITAAADAMDQAQVIRASEGCDFIFNGINPPYPQWSNMCMPIATNMMAAARTHGSTHLFPGNIYNFGCELPEIIEDNTPKNCATKKGNIRNSMENLFEQYAGQYGVQTIIVRAGDFFGGTSTGSTWFDTVISKSLRNGKMTYPGPMDKIHSWAYLPDLARVFVRLAEQAEELENFDVFHFEGHAITGAQLKSGLESVMGRSLKLGGLPWPLLRVAGIFSPMLREICEMSYLWDKAHQMDGTRLAKQVGNLQSTPLEAALSQALADLNMEFLVSEKIPPLMLADAS